MSPGPVPSPLDGHRAETERLGRLTEFLGQFAPAVRHSRDPGRPALDEAGELARARDAAIVEAFRAVQRIASDSFHYTGDRQEIPQDGR